MGKDKWNVEGDEARDGQMSEEGERQRFGDGEEADPRTRPQSE